MRIEIGMDKYSQGGKEFFSLYGYPSDGGVMAGNYGDTVDVAASQIIAAASEHGEKSVLVRDSVHCTRPLKGYEMKLLMEGLKGNGLGIEFTYKEFGQQP